ncbi:hypothetical protein HJFPF1_11796 [Paramyrothecium foliicola]|nr:hypothetical protein HJFPF1_11796 [Paramyrothecium foliicola]
MDPLTLIGAAAASSQLLTQAVKSADAAYRTYQSFRGAPKELEQMTQKLALARDRIKQIQAFGNELSNSDMADLLPEAHRTLLLNALDRSMLAFDQLRCVKESSNPPTLQLKTSWALLDKRRASRIMSDLAETEQALDQVLAILNARLGTLNRTSLVALRAGQVAIGASGARIETAVDAVQQTALSTTSWLQENTVVSQSSLALLQRSAVEQQVQRQQLESMMAMQQQILSHMQKLQTPFPPVYPRKSSEALSNQESQCQSLPTCQKQHRECTVHRNEGISPSGGLGLAMTSSSYQVSEYVFEYWQPPFIRYEPKASSPFATKLCLTMKKNGKRTDFRARASLNLFGKVILQTELCVRMFAMAWFRAPSITTSITTINIRHENETIFKAVRDLDCEHVQKLLHLGEASVHDITAEGGQNLLAIAVSRAPRYPPIYRSYGPDYQRKQVAVEKMLTVLLRAGCDPNVASGRSLPGRSILAFSLQHFNLEVTRILYEHGADVDMLHPLAFNTLGSLDRLREKLSMLQLLGIGDWLTAMPGLKSKNDRLRTQFIVGSYCKLGEPELVIPNLEARKSSFKRETLRKLGIGIRTALAYDALETAAIFISYYAHIYNKFSTARWYGRANDKLGLFSIREVAITPLYGAHLMLSSGIQSGHGLDHYLRRILRYQCQRPGIFYFEELVGVVTHILLHDTDCLLSMSEGNFRKNSAGDPGRVLHVDKSGNIYTGMTDAKSFSFQTEPVEHFNGKLRHETSDGSLPPGISRQDRTQFLNALATPMGRRLLGRYPMATTFWAAVNMAGYRAEIDDDGDVWWSDDDCERYVDAREYQLANDDDGLPQECPMCQKPALWGLETILRRKAAGLAAIDEYRKRKAAKVDWPQTYGTRRQP